MMVGHFATDGPGTDIDALSAELFVKNQVVPISRIFELANSPYNNDNLSLISGSFLKFLFTSYSLDRFQKLYAGLTGTQSSMEQLTIFSNVYLKEFKALQREWVEMLAFGYNIPTALVDEYLLECENILAGYEQ